MECNFDLTDVKAHIDLTNVEVEIADLSNVKPNSDLADVEVLNSQTVEGVTVSKIEDSRKRKPYGFKLKEKASTVPTTTILYLYCHWNGTCCEKFLDCAEIHDHVENHITNYEKGIDYKCNWRSCVNYTTNCKENFSRHCYYHIFLEEIFRNGEVAKINFNLPKCTMDNYKKFYVPNIDKDFVCKWNNCSYVFSSIILFHNHVREHCKFEFQFRDRNHKNRVPVKCNWHGCLHKFTSLYRFKDHAMTHSDEKQVACPDCGAYFKTRSSFQEHCRKNSPFGVFNCERCFTYFSSRASYHLHLQKHENLQKCFKCQMTFPTKKAYTIHLREKHMGLRQYACSQCIYKSTSKGDIARHIQQNHQIIIKQK